MVKTKRLTSKSKVELSSQDAHVPHVKCVNHRVALYKGAAIPILVFEKPKPYDD